jgi:NAD(P)-dependent dehydrogenase (short-subunit alcohol dehydrogenase family)
MESKVAVITGCSSGIGKDLAQKMSAAGYSVVATARNVESIKDLPASLALALDVSDQESVDAAIAAVIEKFGKIDVLVNNSGVSARSAVEEIDETLMRGVFDVNVWGLLRVTKAVLPHMRENRGGRIIHIGSVMGRFVIPLNGGYAASKHAVEALADAMRIELSPFGVKVVIVEPGTIKSGFFESSRIKGLRITGNRESPYAAVYARFEEMSRTPAFEGADPSCVSRVVMHAAQARHPKPRYLAAVSLSYRLMLRLGDASRDRLLERVFKVRRG